MRLVKQVVRPEMGRCGHEAWRGCRNDDFPIPGERPVEFDAHFQIDLTIQVDRKMAPCTRDLLRPDYIPNSTAGVRYDLREFMGSCATTYDRKPASAEPFEPYKVFHANTLCLRTTCSAAAGAS
jgi:hypothetical protein